jgi:hypothetical protein
MLQKSTGLLAASGAPGVGENRVEGDREGATDVRLVAKVDASERRRGEEELL